MRHLLQQTFQSLARVPGLRRARTANVEPQTANCKLRTANSPRAAFTLIELIAVMGIIVALALLVVGGYGGMSRAIASGQASRQVADTLLLARQTACVNGVRVYVYVLSEDEYVLCRKMGTSSGYGGAASYQRGQDPYFKKDAYVFFDYYTDLASFVNEVDRESENESHDNTQSGYADKDLSSNIHIFDLSARSEARYARLRGVDTNRDGVGWCIYFQPMTGGSASSYFTADSDYGISLYPIRSLPKGFVFLDDEIGGFLYFEPTGKADGTLEAGASFGIVVAEAALKGDAKHRQTVKVSSSGKVEVEYPK